MRTTGRLAALSIVLGASVTLAACVPPPYLPADYAAPSLPPLQPYMGPPIAFAAPAPVKHVGSRRHAKKTRRHHRVRCRCAPVR